MQNLTTKILSTLATSALVLALLPTAEAGDITKANVNGVSLYVASSWIGGTQAPGSTDTAVFAYASGGTTAQTCEIGGTMTWYGIKVTDTRAGQTIGATDGAKLTIGAGGISVTRTTGTQHFTIACALETIGNQTWSIGMGTEEEDGGTRFMALSNTVSLDGNLTVQGKGALFISTATIGTTAAVTAPVTITANNVRYGASTTLSFVGTKSITLDANITGTATTGQTITNDLSSGAVLTIGSATRDWGLANGSSGQTLNFTDKGAYCETIIAANIVPGGTATSSIFNFTGTGKLTLSGNNTYAGNTGVSNGGTLMITGTTKLAILTISNNSKLGGSGTIDGQVRINPLGILEADKLTFKNGLDFTSGTAGTKTINFDNNDGAKVSGGTFAWAASAANKITLNINGLSTDWTNEAGAKTLLFDCTGVTSYTGDVANTNFTGIVNNTGVTPAGGVLSLYYNDGLTNILHGDKQGVWLLGLKAAAIPEPSAYALLGAGILVLALRRRKKLS